MTSFSESYPAPAKLNLFLHVVGRRADGYHLLQTVFHFIDYGDGLAFRLRHDGTVALERPLPGVPDERNLCLRAARLLQAEAGCRLGADIRLEKRLPLGGGLGGGSSDAATTLLALNRLWEIGFGRERLKELALRLGADVPVFVYGENALAEGIGEQLQPVGLPPAWYLVLVPPVEVSTAGIFSDPQLTRDTKPIKIFDFSVGYGRNDLEAVVCRKYPAVAEHLTWLRQFGAAAMTGSGACVFASFATEGEARRVWDRLPSAMHGFVARGLERHPLRDLAP
ncbi:MAG: 4-(cytidine 5'-diphospho)-2-C-methyl-D-erythritol kinase [Betaproteobacteria bacterium]|nr:4-(cytidine 5'-diphospho)-2-C-methyl-D-erythritol kinase [Betaproteobacteria bacterium]